MWQKMHRSKNHFSGFGKCISANFLTLIKVNLLFAIPTAVALVLVYFVGAFVMSSMPALSFLSWLPVILLFPFVGGLTFVCRNYAREEHAFILSDFLETVKKNWKAFFLNGIICYVFLVLMVVSYQFLFFTG